jgi:predicted dehydrogenase
VIKILLLGTGEMARAHASAFADIDQVACIAAVDTNPERLADFCSTFAIPHAFANLEEAIAWDGFDAATNVTPDPVHYPTTMQLLAAGKHVLCEKPLATTYAHAQEMTQAAEARGVINMVNLTYRGSPAAAEARNIVKAGGIGQLRHFNAAYLQSWLVGNHWGDWQTEERWLWRLSSGHGSHGVVGDVGVHILDLVSYAANQDIVGMHCTTRTFAKAEDDRIGDYVLDANDTFAMTAEMEGGALGVVQATRWATGHANDLEIDLFGTGGALRLRTTGMESSLHICAGEDVHTQTWREVTCAPVHSVYEKFVTAVRTGKPAQPSFRQAAKIQRILDFCLASQGERLVGVAVD